MEVTRMSRIKRTVRHLRPSHMVRSYVTQRVVRAVANKYGLVYFGYVNPRSDDHRLIRGHTVSTTQIDNHYCVGTVQDYDVALVHRNGLIYTFNKREMRCHWLIVTVDLKTTRELPHFYVGTQTGNEVFEASYTQLHPITLGQIAQYSHKFTSNYLVYAEPDEAINMEWLLHPAVTEVIAAHFSTMTFEVENNILYLYNEVKHPNSEQIDKMFENGIWLAQQIDAVTNADVDRE